MNFSGLLIGSEDPARLVAFYTKVFGTPGWDDGGYVGWMLGTGGITVAAHDQVKGPNSSPGRLIWSVETDDVKGEFERFKRAGARVVAEPYTFEGAPESWIATLADPDDNYFQLVTPMDPSQM